MVGGAIGLGATALGIGLTLRRGRSEPRPLQLEGAASPTLVDAQRGGEVYVNLHIEAPPCPDDDRPPLNLGIVVDTSGSMEGDAIEAARLSVRELLSTLRDDDRVALVAFDSAARVVIASTAKDDLDDDAIDEAIAAMQARGTTDLGGGLRAGLEEIHGHIREGVTSRIVVLSDGVPNDRGAAEAAAAQAASSQVTLTTLGFGLDYDELLLASMASQTGGTFWFVEDTEDLAEAFRAENQRLQDVVARDVRLELVTGPKVWLQEVVGMGIGAGQPRVSLSLGDFSAGQLRDVALRLHVDPHRDGALVELLDATLTAADAATGAALPPARVFVSVRASADAGAVAAAVVPEVDERVEVARTSAATIEAVGAARSGDPEQAAEILEQASAPAMAAGKGKPKARRQAEKMQALAQELRMPATDAPDDGEVAIERAIREAHGSAVRNLQNMDATQSR